MNMSAPFAVSMQTEMSGEWPSTLAQELVFANLWGLSFDVSQWPQGSPDIVAAMTCIRQFRGLSRGYTRFLRRTGASNAIKFMQCQHYRAKKKEYTMSTFVAAGIGVPSIKRDQLGQSQV